MDGDVGAEGEGSIAQQAVKSAGQLGVTVATAESLTAGMVSAALATVPGASAVLRGGIVAYHRGVKKSVLGVEPELLAQVGTVDPEVARQMAVGAAALCGSDVGVATTGVAGPEPHEGKEVGVVFVAAVSPSHSVIREFRFPGDRAAIRRAATEAALRALIDVLDGVPAGTNDVPQ